MIQKAYNITGFDCANCASKTEAHLNRNKNINYARIDFSGNRLYITFKDKEMSIPEILEVIKEVETDPIEISETTSGVHKTSKIITKDLYILIGRIIFAIIALILNVTAFRGDNFFWVRFIVSLVSLLVISYDIVYKVIKHIVHLENPIDEFLLIIIAVTGAFVLETLEKGTYIECILVVALFQIGSAIEGIATNKSKAAIMSAVDIRIETASLLENNEIRVVKPEDLKVGDLIIIKVGERIPVDGLVVDGEATIDTSSLTGEFTPKKAIKDSEVYSGCLLKTGSITVRVNKEYKDSTVSKIMELISSSGEKKSKADKFITKFARWYTPTVVCISILYIVIGGLITKDWKAYVYQGLEFLVVSCPCAIVISVPLAYFSSIGLGSKRGIVIKGTNYLDELVRLKKLVTDKTGTITHGSFSIQHIHPVDCNEEELMNAIYAAECLSTHPIGKAICHEKDLRKLAAEQKDYTEIAGFGIETTYQNNKILVGSKKLLDKYNIECLTPSEIGSDVHCAVNGKYLGYIVLSDTIKEDAQPMVDLLHKNKVEIVLLTGDDEANAKDVCMKLGIDRWHSNLLPEEKESYLELEMKDNKGTTAYIGDGINDAPCISRSDIGIAMGGIGSDMAVENADVVIMNDDPAKVYDAFKIAKIARNVSIFNIVFALFIKIGIMVLVAAQINVPMYVAVLGDTGVTVLLVINSLLILYRKIDHDKELKKK